MIYYAIPLRAKQTSKNWGDVCTFLYKTLKSISLTGGEYKVVIACHDIPDFSLSEFDNRVSFIKVWHPVPTDKNGYMPDKTTKKNIARRKILESAKAGDLFMFIDADDVLARNFYEVISKTFKENVDADDIAFYTGFVFDYKNSKLGYFDGKQKTFYKACGSCFVSKLRSEDISQDDETTTYLFSLKDHTKYPQYALNFGRSVIFLKAPIVCYIANHGSNDTLERVEVNTIKSFVETLECKDQALIKYYSDNYYN